MSNFLWGIAGAAIGSVFGMPVLGFAVGSGAGAALGGRHHPGPSSVPGLRLNDLKVQTSTYGIGIPRIYGRYRLAGNVIWATDIVEIGSPGQSGHFLYYGNFAIGLCRGPVVGIRRIWADGKEIFKDPFLGEGIRAHYPRGLRFYPGDEVQQPDPLLEAHQGKGQVPAFRGLAYIVLEQLPLAPFNNRLPSISVEVVQAIQERPLTPEEATEKTHTEEETTVQNGITYHVKIDRRHKPPRSNKIAVPAPIPLSDMIADLCSQAGFDVAGMDTQLLTQKVMGFVVLPPTSAREALASLGRVYGFDTVEAGKGLRCIPRGQGPLIPLSEDDWAQEEKTAASAGPLLTRSPALECPGQVVLFFNEPNDYKLTTQTAERPGALGRRNERIELPLVLSPEEAAVLVEGIVEEAWAHRVQGNFSLPRAYARLTPGDRLQYQGEIWRVLSLAYGSPGLVKIQAVLETNLFPGSAENTEHTF